jgi:Protein of unknown function (DUF2804)
MPGRDGLRPLKAWRYVGVYGPELMLCAAAIRIGPARQSFWAIWDRRAGRLHERTSLGTGTVRLAYGHLRVDDGEVRVEIELDEEPGIETVCPSGASYAWTRKQGGIRARGTIAIGDRRYPLDARAVIDDTAGYYQRHTRWRWSAGVGVATDGRSLAWNLVAGVNDPPAGSERSLWIDGKPHEPDPVEFAEDLTSIRFADHRLLGFRPEAVRERRENLLLVRSSYRQPFGSFDGELEGGIRVAEGYGVMEEHDVFW